MKLWPFVYLPVLFAFAIISFARGSKELDLTEVESELKALEAESPEVEIILNGPGTVNVYAKAGGASNSKHQRKQKKVKRIQKGNSPYFGDSVQEEETESNNEAEDASDERKKNGNRQRRVGKPLKVGIVGAGMSGLYAALLLQSLNIDYELLEANPDRIGGRIHTHYFNHSQWLKSSPGEADYYDYFDAGAMRFPSMASQERTSGTSSWSLFEYLNRVVEPRHRFRMIPYYLSDYHGGNTFRYFNHKRIRGREMTDGQDDLDFSISNGGLVPDRYMRHGYKTWVDAALEGHVERLVNDWKAGFLSLMQYDHLSTRDFLHSFNHSWDDDDEVKSLIPYPQPLIDYLETMEVGTGMYESSITETVVESFIFSHPILKEHWRCIEGGTSRLVNAIASILRNQPLLGYRVSSVQAVDTDDLPVISKSSKHTKKGQKVQLGFEGRDSLKTYDQVIMTLPYSRYQAIDFANPRLSTDKMTAFRMLSFAISVKVGLKFKRRWWEDAQVMDGRPIFGGSTYTDLPIRTVVYPSHGIGPMKDNRTVSGALIASYAWAQDAKRMISLTDERLVELCLRNLAEIHGDIVYEEYSGQHFIQRWGADDYVGGAFAYFRPTQFRDHFHALRREELDGMVHFAGETASVHHGWVNGALTSAYRAVQEVLEREGLQGKIDEMVEKWGVLDEPSPI